MGIGTTTSVRDRPDPTSPPSPAPPAPSTPRPRRHAATPPRRPPSISRAAADAAAPVADRPLGLRHLRGGQFAVLAGTGDTGAAHHKVRERRVTALIQAQCLLSERAQSRDRGSRPALTPPPRVGRTAAPSVRLLRLAARTCSTPTARSGTAPRSPARAASAPLRTSPCRGCRSRQAGRVAGLICQALRTRAKSTDAT
jgi:hypothetical protein